MPAAVNVLTTNGPHGPAGVTVVTAINYWEELTGTKGISFLWAMPLSFLAQTAVGMAVSLCPIGSRPQIAPADLLEAE